jgi:hypothetical protein
VQNRAPLIDEPLSAEFLEVLIASSLEDNEGDNGDGYGCGCGTGWSLELAPDDDAV